jgi:hypothetical protein
VIAAFAYLLFNSTRNRLQSQLRRLRTPRYAIGFALGVGYFWLVFGRHIFAAPNGRAVTPESALGAATGSLPLDAIVPALIAVVFAGIWIFGGDMSALAFSEAEVSMLLTAPVPRRGLVIYKLAQSQIIIVINVLIWTFILRRGNSSLPSVLSATAIWVIFTTLNLHRMGAALSRASRHKYRAAGKKKRWAAKAFAAVVFVAVFTALIVGPLSELEAPDASNPFGFFRTILRFFESPGVKTALYPFHLLSAASFARTPGAWAAAMLPALAIVLAHVWWVVRSDAAFEEAAAMASTERAKKLSAIRERRSGAALDLELKTGGRTVGLASTGLPWIAILWKNVIATRRTIKPGALLRLPILIFAAAAFIGSKSGNPATAVFASASFMAVMLPILVIQVLRNDLRTDMMNLPLLKTLPLAGGDLVLAEVASGAAAMLVVQLVLFAIAGAALLARPGALHVPVGIATGAAITLPVTLLSLDVAICTIINGSAVLFPGWIRLGPAGAGGVEMMGQAMLGMIASLLTFALLLLLPAAIGAGIWYLLSAVPALATAAACAFGAAVLGAESYIMMQALGHAFERAEPQQVT